MGSDSGPASTTISSSKHVAIVGAGFAGLALALSLHAHSILFTIYERHPHPSTGSTTGGIIGLAPNALRVLSRIGVYDRIRARAFTHEKLTLYNVQGAKLIAFNNGNAALHGFAALTVARRVVQEELVKAVEERVGSQRIVWGQKMVRVGESDDRDDGVMLTFEDGESVRAAFVIGADGIYSTLRTHVAPGVGTPQYHGVVRVAGTVSVRDVPGLLSSGINNTIDCNDGTPGPAFDHPCIFTGRNGNFGIFPADHAGDEVAFSTYFEIEEEGRGRAGWKALGEDRARLAAMVRKRFCSDAAAGEWPDVVREICERVQESKMLAWPTFTAPNLETWRSRGGRVIVIGDAAHGMPPDAGQGAAMALEDAETLGHVLSLLYTPSHSFTHALNTNISTSKHTPLLLDDPQTTSRLLSAWEFHRRQRVDAIKTFTSRGGLIRRQSGSAALQWVKETVLWGIGGVLGPDYGTGWVYGYDGESVLKELARALKSAS